MMEAALRTLDLWTMRPWLPWSWLAIAVLGFFLLASYAWLTRPSGRSGLEPPPLGRKLLPLAVLAAPLLVFLGFARTAAPMGPPEFLVLRSHAVGVSSDLSPDPCFAQSLAAADSGRAAPPCLTSGLPAAGAEREAFERWWRLARELRRRDARPVVDHALRLFSTEQARFSDQDYAQGGSRDLIAALGRAVERAVAEVAPSRLAPGAAPSLPPRMARNRPAVEEAIEAAVVRLIVARRNVRALLVEYHGRDDEAGEAGAWAPLARDFRDGAQIAASAPVDLRLAPGSRRSASRVLSVIGEPWRRSLAGAAGEIEANATLRFGEKPAEAWSLSLRSAGRAAAFSCLGRPSTEREALVDCLADGRSLEAGESAFLSLSDLRIGGAPSPDDAPLNLVVDFADPGLENLDRAFEPANRRPASLSLDGAAPLGGSGAEMRTTLACLLSPSSSVRDFESMRRLRALVADGGAAAVALGAGGATIRADRQTGGVWIYPEDLWDRVEQELRAPLLAQGAERLIDLEALMRPGGELFGAALFPTAFPAPSASGGFGARASFPLRPDREPGSPRPGEDPAQGLRPPRAVSFHASYAKPVLFSSLPAHLRQAGSSFGIHAIATAPLVWRIDLPRSATGRRGGIVWHFALDPERQGLLLGADCRPQGLRDAAFFCAPGDYDQMQVHEPGYDEARFFPVWLWLLRAARESAVSRMDDGTVAAPSGPAPAILSSEMALRARIGSAELGFMLLILGLCLHAVVLIGNRMRQRAP